MFGYNIEKYYNPRTAGNRILSIHGQIGQKAPSIPTEMATKALISVGRKPHIRAFAFYERPKKSSAEMDKLENIWWNSNSNIIEKVWVFSEDVNISYRKPYVSRAALFFKENVKESKILDLGCGSGWFGRMIADKDIEYYGMDFSSTQIDIANSKKQKVLNKNYLNYYCINDFKKINNISSITGVVIHAFLHHLYWEELYLLFDELAEILPNDCKFFITEPIYPNQNNIKYISKEEENSNIEFVKAYRLKLDLIKNELINKNLYDTKTEYELMKLCMESNQNGFFLSPKEVPFKLNEFQTFLTKYLKIEKQYHCGVLNLETAQLIERINTKELQEHYSRLLFPIANSLDKNLLNNYYFETNQNNYLFTVFECVLYKGVVFKQ